MRETRTARGLGTIVLFLLGATVSCGGEIPVPEPPPLPEPPSRYAIKRESDDWVKPGRMVHLYGVSFDLNGERVRVRNSEPFALVLLDDIWLFLAAPDAEVRTDGPQILCRSEGCYLYLRCPVPDVIPTGGELEIPYDACFATTYEPGPSARVIGFRLTAREGYRETAIDGGPVIVRE